MMRHSLLLRDFDASPSLRARYYFLYAGRHADLMRRRAIFPARVNAVTWLHRRDLHDENSMSALTASGIIGRQIHRVFIFNDELTSQYQCCTHSLPWAALTTAR